MPPTLYLQADNCVKDNKNAFLMMFLTYLIKKKIFKEVIFFMHQTSQKLVGHIAFGSLVRGVSRFLAHLSVHMVSL